MNISTNISTKLHTIFIIVGPSNCEKFTFCTKHLVTALQETLINNKIRPNVHYLDVNMAVSEQEFTILSTQIKTLTTFPVNAHFIVVDTTDLNIQQVVEKVMSYING